MDMVLSAPMLQDLFGYLEEFNFIFLKKDLIAMEVLWFITKKLARGCIFNAEKCCIKMSLQRDKSMASQKPIFL